MRANSVKIVNMWIKIPEWWVSHPWCCITSFLQWYEDTWVHLWILHVRTSSRFVSRISNWLNCWWCCCCHGRLYLLTNVFAACTRTIQEPSLTMWLILPNASSTSRISSLDDGMGTMLIGQKHQQATNQKNWRNVAYKQSLYPEGTWKYKKTNIYERQFFQQYCFVKKSE